jgi:hypothetical protein
MSNAEYQLEGPRNISELGLAKYLAVEDSHNISIDMRKEPSFLPPAHFHVQ